MFKHITSSTDLHIILRKMYSSFSTHVVPIDKLNEVQPAMKQIFIVNFERSDQYGSHWVLILCKEKRFVEYVDSFGLNPPDTILEYLRRYTKEGIADDIIMTTKQVQKKNEKHCGWILLRYLHHRIHDRLEPWEAINKINYKDTIRHGQQLTKLYLKKRKVIEV